MEVIILAGGLGTRLKEVVSDVPKPLALINQTPFLDLILEQLISFKLINKVILAIGYKAELVIDYYSKKTFPFNLEYSVEKFPLGTGGALKRALGKTSGQVVLAMNGDTYLDLPFDSFLEFHKNKEADLTMACLEAPKEVRYGAVIFDENFRIKDFAEKEASHWINAGFYLINPTIFDFCESDVFLSLEKDLFPLLLKKKMMGYPCRGKFIDIGTKSSYFEAQTLLRK